MGFVAEFKNFIYRGNAIDLAIGVIIGGAFGKIVTSLVNDLLMPPLGLAVGGLDFKAYKTVLGGPADAPVTLNWGNFVQTRFDFLILGLCVFLIVRAVNRMKPPAETAPAAPPADVALLTEIRDLLAARNPARG
jgi:large conductance mechanosensitive channel